MKAGETPALLFALIRPMRSQTAAGVTMKVFPSQVAFIGQETRHGNVLVDTLISQELKQTQRKYFRPDTRASSARCARAHSKLVAAPTLEATHLSNSAWLSTISVPRDMLAWLLPQSCAQLI